MELGKPTNRKGPDEDGLFGWEKPHLRERLEQAKAAPKPNEGLTHINIYTPMDAGDRDMVKKDGPVPYTNSEALDWVWEDIAKKWEYEMAERTWRADVALFNKLFPKEPQ